MPPTVTDYRGHHRTLLPDQEINLKACVLDILTQKLSAWPGIEPRHMHVRSNMHHVEPLGQLIPRPASPIISETFIHNFLSNQYLEKLPIFQCWKSGKIDLNRSQYLNDLSLDHDWQTYQVSWKLVRNNLSNLVNRQTNRQSDKPTKLKTLPPLMEKITIIMSRTAQQSLLCWADCFQCATLPLEGLKIEMLWGVKLDIIDVCWVQTLGLMICASAHLYITSSEERMR